MQQEDLKFKQQVLDPISSSFCAAKWYNATIWLGSGMTTSCHHPLPHKVSVEEVEANFKALHNTAQKKKERQQMLDGERPAGCDYCWRIEDMGKDSISDRVYKTKIYTPEEIRVASMSDPNKDFNLRTLEIAFDRTCNLACSYCNPAFSTTWVKDIKKHGAYKSLTSDGRNHFTHEHKSSQLYKYNETNPYVEAFFKWWESDLHETLDELRITGGEPLMSQHTWRLIDWFLQNPKRSKTRLAINSNLNVDKKKLDKLCAVADHIELDIYTSVESTNAQQEYIRDGFEWSPFVNNLQTVFESNVRRVHFMSTISALSIPDLKTYLDWTKIWKHDFGNDRCAFTLNILRFPSFQSPAVLPRHIRLQCAEEIESWAGRDTNKPSLHEMEINQIQRLADYLRDIELDNQTQLQSDFMNFFQQYDQRRNKNFAETFPNLNISHA
tara:strand:- start:2413 stop:3729 length:1317 start_codon:yes stop_codon:yes gene_type:complete